MHARDALTLISIAVTSLTAGSIFCFPLFGPTLTRDLGLNLTQTNTLWGGAVLGEYLTAAIWGALGDRYGPRLLSVSAGILFLVGYQLMSRADTIALHVQPLQSGIDAGETHRSMATGSFYVTLAAFTGIGSGVAASYFAAVTASTRILRSHPGIAIAGPLTLFSLSSLFLTSLGTRFFSDARTGDLDASAFLSFLGWLLGATNLLSSFFIQLPVATTHRRKPDRDSQHSGEVDERTSLFESQVEDGEGDDNEGRSIVEATTLSGLPESQSTFAFLSTPAVWSLGLLMVAGVGASEMVLSSVGNMVVALMGSLSRSMPASQDPAAQAYAMTMSPHVGPIALEIRASQVKLLAAANTLSRLASGLLSDWLAPKASSPGGTSEPRRRIQVSRLALLFFAIALLSVAFAWAAFGLETVDGLPAFSVAVGVGYGLIFTLVPAITLSAFGGAHFGRNWGILSYCCAAGSLAYSLLYALVSDAVADRQKDGRQSGSGATCTGGPQCFQPSFVVSLLGMLLAAFALLPVYKKWSSFL
ncbi:unnamed protein product [Parajaminaea phylloscopi]